MKRTARGGTPAYLKRTPSVVIFLVISLLVGSTLLAEGPEPLIADPTAAAELRGICHRFQNSQHGYYGLLTERELRKTLETSEPQGLEAILLRARLARELLQKGESGEAVSWLEEALRLPAAKTLEAKDRVTLLHLLALAHLQAGEDANCVTSHNAASCILPFAPDALHRQADDARRAGDLFLTILELEPRDVKAAWLLNLARMVTNDYPKGVPPQARLPPTSLAGTASFPRWIDRASELGLGDVDTAGGAVTDDFDGDGLIDIITSSCDPCDSLKAYRNDGSGSFENVTRAWGLDEQLGGLNLIHGDFDNDGRLDLLVLRGAWMAEDGRVRSSLLHNQLSDPGGRFVDVTRAAGLAEPAYPSQTAAWADYDGDGDLDLFVGNEAQPGASYPSQLWRNDGGRFVDVAQKAGVQNNRFAKGVAWGDYDDDGDSDLYVSNFGPNRLFRNDGDGTFSDVAPALGVTAPEDRSFATWFFDFDNDGDLDLFVVDYNGPVGKSMASYFGVATSGGGPRLYRNEGGRFSEVGSTMGLDRPLMPMGANYGDLDNDGWLDIYLGTGDPQFDSLVPNIMLRNQEGRTFEDITFAGGFGHLQKGHGVAFADLDNDGDQDLVHQLGGFFVGDAFHNAVFENPGPVGDWLTLELRGQKANRFAVGARVAVRVAPAEGPERTIHALVGSGGSFGGSSLRLELGLGDVQRIVELTVRWPGSGTIQSHASLVKNRAYRVTEGAAEIKPLELPHIVLGGAKNEPLADSHP